MESDGTVRHEVVVGLSQEAAFWRFTDLDRIKPRSTGVSDGLCKRSVLIGGLHDRCDHWDR